MVLKKIYCFGTVDYKKGVCRFPLHTPLNHPEVCLDHGSDLAPEFCFLRLDFTLDPTGEHLF